MHLVKFQTVVEWPHTSNE